MQKRRNRDKKYILYYKDFLYSIFENLGHYPLTGHWRYCNYKDPHLNSRASFLMLQRLQLQYQTLNLNSVFRHFILSLITK